MKKTGKVLLTVFSGLLLVVGSVLGTMAYLHDDDTVTNTFTVGTVEIKLDEADVNEMGEIILDDNDNPVERVRENTYHLIPGHTYTKDPMVTVLKGSEESYVRMIMTVNEQADLDEIFAPGKALEQFFVGYDKTKWLYQKETENNDDTRTYEFRYYTKVPAAAADDKALEPLFESIKVPAEVRKEQLTKLAELEIKVEAHAIQADGFETADAAWTAFDQSVAEDNQ